MRKLIFGLIMVSIGFTSCVKDDFNVDEEIAIIGTEWKGKGKLDVDSDSVDLKLSFLKDGMLQAIYDTTRWEGTYNFNLESNEGIIIDTADRQIPFNIKVDTLRFFSLEGDTIRLQKLKCLKD